MTEIKLLSYFVKELEKANLIEIKTNKDLDILANKYLTNQKL